MVSLWLTITMITAVLALLVALLLGCLSWEHRRFARGRLNKRYVADDRLRVALFAPCKGVDVGLKENLRPLFCQDYGNYEIVFIVEHAEDPACPTIRELCAEYSEIDSRLVVAGQASDAGQKVHNLRAATDQLPPEVEILAFVDSDARPRSEWIGNLVQRLAQPDVGISTGYRWFVPERPTLANYLLYSINATIASLYSPKGLKPVWGGSWAIRRDMFEQVELHSAWDGTLTDDLVASNLVQRSDLRIEFEPTCMMASPLDVSFGQMFDFLRRQYMIGRHYMPGWWATTLLATTVMTLGFWGALAALGVGLVSQASWVWWPALAAATLYLWGMFRASIRRELADMYCPQHKQILTRAVRFDIWLAPLAALVNWLALFSTVAANQFVWRGITYQLLPNGLTRVVSRQEIEPVTVHWSVNAKVVRPPQDFQTEYLAEIQAEEKEASQKTAADQQAYSKAA